MDMTPDRWSRTCSYLAEVFGHQDDHLASLMPRAMAHGIPAIAISPDVGRFLSLLVGLSNGGRGATRALELGALAGYSGIWIARALAPGGTLITIEPEPKHAAFARREFERAGVSDRVEVFEQLAIPALESLNAESAQGTFDFILFDAIKTEYPEYFRLIAPLLKPGGLLVADNALGSGSWWIDQPPGASPERDAIDAFNRMVASDPRFEAACAPIREGVLIARRVS